MEKNLADLTNQQLFVGVRESLSVERGASARVLALLGEIEARGIYRDKACSSMWTFCVERLGFSENETSIRLRAARAARAYPIAFEMVAGGRLHLTGLAMLKEHLTPDNHRDVLASAEGRTRDEIQELIARVAPKPDVPDAVRKVPAAKKHGTGQPATSETNVTQQAEMPLASRASLDKTVSSAHGRQHTAQPTILPLAPERYKVTFTASKATRDKLRRAQDLLRHTLPDGDLGEVFDRALDLLVEDLERKKFARVKRPRAKSTVTGNSKPSRYVPAAVRREVSERDQDRCTFVDDGGNRCAETAFLEFDHARPKANAGGETADNIRIRCRAHNRLAAEQAFGRAFIKRKIRDNNRNTNDARGLWRTASGDVGPAP